MNVLNFLKTHEKAIGSVAAVASTIGIIFAAIGLYGTKEQIADARKALEATTVYTMQKDARELQAELVHMPKVLEYITKAKPGENQPPEVVAEAEFKIRQLVQFYSAVFNQRRNGVITEKYWDTFANEMCVFIRYPAVTEFWKKRVIPGTYGDEFKRFGNQCLEPQTP